MTVKPCSEVHVASIFLCLTVPNFILLNSHQLQKLLCQCFNL